ncbi:MAG: type II secretion system protein [Mariprofundaceae bacterium]
MQPVLCVRSYSGVEPRAHGIAQQGFSLVELSVVMTIVAVLLALAYNIIPKQQDMNARQQSREALQKADEAVFGFAVQNYRLPCPDVNGDGVEQCVTTNHVGSLPWKTLGLSSKPVGSTGTSLKYGVYRGASDLAVASNLFVPMLPATNASGTMVATPATINGFDFCRNIRNAGISTLNTGALNVTNNVNVAYALADVGAGDANASVPSSFWDGLNTVTGTTFDSPDKMVSQTYDDLVIASSFHRILGRMGCEEMGRPHAAGISAIASVDIYNVWKLMFDVRTNDKNNADMGLLFAQIGVAKAAFEAAMAAYGLASTVACTGLSAGVCAFNVILAGVQVAAAIAAIVQAAIGLVNAQATLTSAIAALAAVTTSKSAALTFADQSVANALSIDAAGLRR